MLLKHKRNLVGSPIYVPWEYSYFYVNMHLDNKELVLVFQEKETTVELIQNISSDITMASRIPNFEIKLHILSP
jgi:hypothetical protein